MAEYNLFTWNIMHESRSVKLHCSWCFFSEQPVNLFLLCLLFYHGVVQYFYCNVLWHELSFVNTPQLLLQYLSLGGILFFPCIYYTKNKKKTKETEKIWPNDTLPHHASFAKGLNNTLRHCGYWHMGGLNNDDVWVVIADWKLYKSHMLIKVFSNNIWVWKSRSCQLAHRNFLFFQTAVRMRLDSREINICEVNTAKAD